MSPHFAKRSPKPTRAKAFCFIWIAKAARRSLSLRPAVNRAGPCEGGFRSCLHRGSSARDEQNNPPNDTDAADDGPDRNWMFFVFVYLQRAQFRHIFLRRVTGVTAVRQHDDANDNKNDTNDSGWFHRSLSKACACPRSNSRSG